MKRAIATAVLMIAALGVCSAQAMTWVEREGAGSRDWSAIATSADGTCIAAVDSGKSTEGGDIWTSSNGGITWTDQKAAGAHNWAAIAMSADGKCLAAAEEGMDSDNGPGGGDIWTSSNGGVSWTDQKAAGARHWAAIASSADGKRLAAVDRGERGKDRPTGGDIWTSVDGGKTWADRKAAGLSAWIAIASSADGNSLVAAGQRPSSAPTGDSVKTVDIDSGDSGDGSGASVHGHLVMSNGLEDGGDIWTSTDGGATWTDQKNAGSLVWEAVASSADGKHLAACGGSIGEGDINNEEIWTSSDRGATWTEQKGAGETQWHALASNADGRHLAAADNGDGQGGDIWTTAYSYSDLNDDEKTAASANGDRMAAAFLAGTKSLNAVDDYGVTTFMWLVRNDTRIADMEKALGRKPDLSRRDKEGNTPLILAANHNTNVKVLNALLKAGAKVEEVNYYGNTPLMRAAAKNANVEVLKALLEAGAKIEVRNNDGDTPLMVAAEVNTNVEVLKALLAAGANVEVKNNRGDTPLMCAAEDNSDVEVLKALLKAGAKVEEKDSYGNTPLMMAAAWNANVEVLKVLLEAGSGVNDRNNSGDTPLIWAAYRSSNVDVISTLIKAGADLSARTKNGDTALEVTRYNDNIKDTDALQQFRKLLGAKD